MSRSLPRLVVALLMAALLGGCAGTSALSASGAQRDTQAARRHIARGVELLNKNEVEQAQAMFDRAINADAYSGVAHNNMGITYYRQQNYYQAAWYFQNAARLLPYHPQPRNNLGLVFEAAGKLDDAVAEYDQALSLEPGNPQLIGNLARARLHRGDDGPQMQQLLEKLVMGGTRPEWQLWARRQLILMKRDGVDATHGHETDEQ